MGPPACPLVPQCLDSATNLVLVSGAPHERGSRSAFTKRHFHATSWEVRAGILPGWPLLGSVACGRARGSTVGGPLLVSQTQFPRVVLGEDPRAGS